MSIYHEHYHNRQYHLDYEYNVDVFLLWVTFVFILFCAVAKDRSKCPCVPLQPHTSSSRAADNQRHGSFIVKLGKKIDPQYRVISSDSGKPRRFSQRLLWITEGIRPAERKMAAYVATIQHYKRKSIAAKLWCSAAWGDNLFIQPRPDTASERRPETHSFREMTQRKKY